MFENTHDFVTNRSDSGETLPKRIFCWWHWKRGTYMVGRGITTIPRAAWASSLWFSERKNQCVLDFLSRNVLHRILMYWNTKVVFSIRTTTLSVSYLESDSCVVFSNKWGYWTICASVRHFRFFIVQIQMWMYFWRTIKIIWYFKLVYPYRVPFFRV